MTAELKPCPFCGVEASEFKDRGHSTAYNVGCFNGDCTIEPNTWADTKAEAIAAWNTRADLSRDLEQARQDIADLRQAVRYANDHADQAKSERDAQQSAKDGAYLERNRLVALLAAIFPAGIKRTKIEGWSPDWHGCVYIDFPWGQASWHYHDSHAHLFSHLPPYPKDWDGHTTEGKYEAIGEAAVRYPISAVDGYAQHIRNERDAALARAEKAEADRDEWRKTAITKIEGKTE